MNDPVQTKEGFLDRRITLRWMLILLGLVILAGFYAWIYQSLLIKGQRSAHMSAILTLAGQSAEAVARSIATFGNAQIVAGNWDELQGYADEVVGSRRLAYVAIVNPAGVAVVHTNRSFRGKAFTEPVDTEDVVHTSVPAMSRTRQVASVRVGLYTVEVPGGGLPGQ